jgi:hypothetical protein
LAGRYQFSFTIKTIIKYLLEPHDYKQYSELGKKNIIPRPEVCPYCGAAGCLIGHGWFKKKASVGILTVSKSSG